MLIYDKRLHKILKKLFGICDYYISDELIIINLFESAKLEDLIALKKEFRENYSITISSKNSKLTVNIKKQ
jgi:hypothetical protein